MYAPFLQVARAKDVAIELNTAGLRKECQEIYPSLDILRKACALGVAITFGSDAHAPGEVGMNFAEAIAWARAAGATHYGQFEQRRRVSLPLPEAG